MAVNINYVFNVFLRKQIALKSDEIAGTVEELIKKHFDSHPKDKLDTTQIHRFTGIAYSSDSTKSLQEFIERQVTKEKKAREKPWTKGDLHKRLLSKIKEIVGKDSNEVYEKALNKTKESLKNVENVEKEFDEANKKEIVHDISIELLKRFATHFGIHYLYKKGG
ncbi:MAG: hypothetical protein DDT22_00427 [candidate division WS2 bacterium]|nr:hypothetical protein [Candidatus Lithacetigena glycinireducens]